MGKKRSAKKAHKLRLYGQICGKHNHVSKDCWKDPKNAAKRPDSWKYDEELITKIGMGIDDNVVIRVEDGLVGVAQYLCFKIRL
jgi:hypothetical protein